MASKLTTEVGLLDLEFFFGLGFGFEFGFWVFFLFLFLFLSNANSNSNSRQMNSNKFEFTLALKQLKQNSSMMHKHVDPKIIFNYLCNKIGLNARLSKLNPRKLINAN